jgi:glutathionylspermidine synthase
MHAERSVQVHTEQELRMEHAASTKKMARAELPGRMEPLPARHDEVFSGEIARRIPYHRMNGKQYCLPVLTRYAPGEIAALRQAAEQVDRIYTKVLRFAQRYLPDSFLTGQLGLHPSLLPAARMEVPHHGISRQDWILGPQGMKCIENNTDTPTGVPEAAWLADALISAYSSHGCASTDMRTAIREAFSRLFEAYAHEGLSGLVAFTSYDWHLEDRTNTEYIMEAVRESGCDAVYVPLHALEIVPNDGLYAAGKRIAVLYRLYPLEYLVHDRDEASREPVGEDLLALVMQGKLALINPVQSAITQSKGFMALIWSLYERRDETESFCGFRLFDGLDERAISAYLLPTYYEPAPFALSGQPYVAKSYWGREGKGTALYDAQGVLEASEWGFDPEEIEDVQDYYGNQPKIYQRRIDMEEVVVPTEDGPFTGALLTGAYVVGGRFAGVLPRVGGKITGDMAYYCPAAIISEEE